MDEITDLEKAFYELEKIKQQINLLSDFLASKLRDQANTQPKTSGMVDPRTGELFGNKN